MSDPVVDAADEIEETGEDVEEDLRELVKDMGIRLDALEGTVSSLNATPSAAHTEQEVAVNNQGASAVTDNDVDDDPYSFERAPIRKHTLFRRIFG